MIGPINHAMNLLLWAFTGPLLLLAMQYEATIEVGDVGVRAIWSARSGAEALDVAQGGAGGSLSVRARQYSAWLDRSVPLDVGAPYWVTYRGRRFVAYVARQTGRSVRFARRDGEFYPGLVLERLGRQEDPYPGPTTGGDGWFLAQGPLGITYYTRDFLLYEEVPALAGLDYRAVTLAGSVVVLAAAEAIWYSADGALFGRTDLAGCGAIRALSWDGTRVWVLAEGGAFAVDWATKAPTLKHAGDFHGTFRNAGNPVPFLVRAAGAGGYDVISAQSGNLFFHTDQAVEWRDNTYLWYPRFFYMDDGTSGARRLWRRYDGAETIIASVPIRFEDDGSAIYRLRDVGVVLAEGALYTFRPELEELTFVYDFESVLIRTPSLHGPVVQRLSDGTMYRIRRLP